MLQEHPAVDDALCAGVPDPLLGETVHALVVARDPSGLDLESLLGWMAARIERYKLPDALHLVDALPVGPTGKRDRGAVAQIVTGGSPRRLT